MAAWGEFESEAPELAGHVRRLFDAGKHKTIATLRRDGSPRISGIEAWFWDGELWFGSMWQAVKALDLKRDPRFALHSASLADGWEADAKAAGRAEVTEDPAGIARVIGDSGQQAPEGARMHLFRADLCEVVHIHLNEARTELVSDAWHEGRGVSSHSR